MNDQTPAQPHEHDVTSSNQTIHDFDLTLIYEYFSTTERQGPGSTEETLKALSFIQGLSEKSKIAA